MKKQKIDEIRLNKNGDLIHLSGTVEKEYISVQTLIQKYTELQKEVERKEKVLLNFCEIRDRMGDQFYDYSKTWGMYS